MSNELEKILHLKQETQQLEEIFRLKTNSDQIDYIKLANRLHDCTKFIKLAKNNYGSLTAYPIYPCQVPFCPLCLYFNARKERGKYNAIYHQITQDKSIQNPRFFLLTLTVAECGLNKLAENLAWIKQAYTRLTKDERWKKVVVGAANYLHIKLDNFGVVRPHFHVLLVSKPNLWTQFHNHRIDTKSMWAEMWRNALDADYVPHVDLKELGHQGKSQATDVMNFISYGMDTLKFKYIQKYPSYFLEVLAILKSVHKHSQQGVIRKKNTLVIKGFESSLLESTFPESTILMFNGSNYQNHRIINQSFDM